VRRCPTTRRRSSSRCSRRGRMMRSLATVLLFASVALGPNAAAGPLPLQVELDGCVEPAQACATRDVVTLNDGNRRLSFAVEALRLRSSSHATSGGVLAEMKLRPLRVHGPDELVHRLTPGAQVRVRGALRLRERYLIVQSVEPRQ